MENTEKELTYEITSKVGVIRNFKKYTTGQTLELKPSVAKELQETSEQLRLKEVSAKPVKEKQS